RFAAGAIADHPTRSALTALGVVIGVAAVVMMTSIGLGAQQRVTGAISGLGTNLIVITPAFGRPGAAGPARQAAGEDMTVSSGDADAIRSQIEGIVAERNELAVPSLERGRSIVLPCGFRIDLAVVVVAVEHQHNGSVRIDVFASAVPPHRIVRKPDAVRRESRSCDRCHVRVS
ncbi:MAG: hypothetical protein B7Z55_11695, partial [Planctomycetales bacterium 12-60-4]